MKAKLSRRLVLRGLGGAAVTAPFLSSVVERAAKAQGVPSTDPRRLIVMFTHYGCLTDRWFPLRSHGTLGADDYRGTSLEPLAPHASKLLMPRGIRAMNEWSFEGIRGQINDPHTQVVGSYFTCVPVTPNATEIFDSVAKFEAKPTAPSLDHVCAKQVNASGRPFVLRVGRRNDNPQSEISYSAAETAFAGLQNPTDALAELTGLFGDGAVSPDSYRVARGQSIIDAVRDDLDTLERFDMSSADQQKLAAWKELLHETVTGVTTPHCTADTSASLGLTDTNLATFAAAEGDILTTPIGGSLDGADLYTNLAVLAALCDHSRVTVLKYPAMYVFEGLGITIESHLLSHRGVDQVGRCRTDANELLESVDRYYAQKFANLIARLDSFEEGSGSVLDNTAAVWFQEMSDGAAHNLNNLPIIQAGSCGGYFKTGQAVNVDDGASDLSRGNSVAYCEAAQQPDPIPNSGTPAEFANAPINKYFCNLMNAIGVKAGADGFPTEGGTAEVTHFGMYDDTTDFSSGGTNDPQINDPGEFAELRQS